MTSKTPPNGASAPTAARLRADEFSVRADEALSRKQFLQRTGISRYQFPQLVREGLRIRQAGRRKFILGSDWIEFLARK